MGIVNNAVEKATDTVVAIATNEELAKKIAEISAEQAEMKGKLMKINVLENTNDKELIQRIAKLSVDNEEFKGRFKAQEKTIEKQEKTIEEQEKTIEEQEKTIEEQGKIIVAQGKTIEELKARIKELEKEIAILKQKNKTEMATKLAIVEKDINKIII